MQRIAEVLRMALVFELLLGGLFFTVFYPLAYAQNLDVLNERVNAHGATLLSVDARLVTMREEINNLRVVQAVFADNMIEVKWLGRCVAAAVLGQLVLVVFEKRKNR